MCAHNPNFLDEFPANDPRRAHPHPEACFASTLALAVALGSLALQGAWPCQEQTLKQPAALPPHVARMAMNSWAPLPVSVAATPQSSVRSTKVPHQSNSLPSACTQCPHPVPAPSAQRECPRTWQRPPKEPLSFQPLFSCSAALSLCAMALPALWPQQQHPGAPEASAYAALSLWPSPPCGPYCNTSPEATPVFDAEL